MWSSQIEVIISRLIRDQLLQHEWTRQQADRVGALYVGWDLWSCWFLRASGEIVLVTEDPADADVSRTDQSDRLRALAWAANKYSDLVPFLPLRETDAPDCPLTDNPKFHVVNDEALCPVCCGLGWVPQIWR